MSSLAENAPTADQSGDVATASESGAAHPQPLVKQHEQPPASSNNEARHRHSRLHPSPNGAIADDIVSDRPVLQDQSPDHSHHGQDHGHCGNSKHRRTQSQNPSESPPIQVSVISTPTTLKLHKIPIPPISDAAAGTGTATKAIPNGKVLVQQMEGANSWSNSLYKPLKAHLTLLHPQTPPGIIAFCATRLLSPDKPYGYTDEEDWIPLYLDRILDGNNDFDGEKYNDGSAMGREVEEAHGIHTDGLHDCNSARGVDIGLSSHHVSPASDSDTSPNNEKPHKFNDRQRQRQRQRPGIGFDLLTAGVRYDAPKNLREKHDQSQRAKMKDERLERMYAAARDSWALLELKGPSTGCRL
ncbi:hypothetical protein IAT40_004415 [Kwoniella sp. CBS 6097]